MSEDTQSAKEELFVEAADLVVHVGKTEAPVLALEWSSSQTRSEASLPIYMLHQTVIVVIGFFIQDWQMGILPKFLLLLIATSIGIMTIYEILIRRINIMRVLFGLKQKR